MGHDHHHPEYNKDEPPPYLPDDPRWEADERLWQLKPIRVEVDAERFVGVTPFLPAGITVEPVDGRFVIHGEYGLDLFRNHRFVIRVDGEIRTYTRLEDIPDVIESVVGFHPDDTHDVTLTYTFEKDGQPFTHVHWIHHDMDPWPEILQQILKREDNGGWNARRDALRRRRHHALHPHDAHDGESQRVRKRAPRLETG